MEPNELILERLEGFCALTINRPEKMNSLSPDLLLKIKEVLDSLSGDRAIRAVVITGAGDKAFSAGYDFSAFPTKVTPESKDNWKKNIYLEACVESISFYTYPVIAMINGYSFGGGCELAISCDIRIASDKATFCMPPAKLGLVYSPQGIKNFINIIGFAHTKEIFFTGRRFDAQRAKEIGLVNHVVPSTDLKAFTYDMAQEISENAPLSLSAAKLTISKFMNLAQLSEKDEEVIGALRLRAFESHDLKEGRRALKEKRKPRFRGE